MKIPQYFKTKQQSEIPSSQCLISSGHAYLFKFWHHSILLSKDTRHHAAQMNMVPYGRTYCEEQYVSPTIKKKKVKKKAHFLYLFV